ncbi:Cysteine proteinase inhibitor B [Capsicum baccatum]|uniref:Cysteine proteinase inhibitor B n=1 Tax=Capsicum baccatum TaxID=33114 RepID=A0A2G2W2H0_CAPBA|nr:Cysteine proteinase inhibitor B [Capsicum baccatum]PHU03526.1 Cysteine proteinase inhibitor B [Capsicum chinense]
MAKISTKILSSILFLLIIYTLFFTTPSYSLGQKVGGITQIKDVKNNKEIQELGKYCVEEHNRNLQKKKDSNGLLSFSQVVEAEKQVVSGIKYYLKISAITTSTSKPKMFDAVIVVKSWEKKKELLNFSPSPSPATK